MSHLAAYSRGLSLFCRGVGAIYLIALVSWWLQAEILILESGLVPIATWLDVVGSRLDSGAGTRWQVPTLFWLTGASDIAIHSWLAVGCIAAVLVIMGIGQGPALVAVWLVYLSLVTTGDTFMSFQWDILLLEAGVLAMLVSSWRWREPWRAPPGLSLRQQVGLILVWLAVAKLMFLSGWVKLAWATEAQPEWWPAHTAMLYHYQTQPLPTVSAWWMHQLPEWLHKASIWPMYTVELVCPFLICFGRRLRLAAAIGFAGLMLLILATGNYTYFNWLTIILCLPLVHDRYWRTPTADSHYLAGKKWLSAAIASPALLLVLLLNLHILARDLHRAPKPLLAADLSPKRLDQLATQLSPWQLSSGYGLFRTMTTTRPEIILEGSADGQNWLAYDFHWKPDRLDERPRLVAPHQPRVAWQMWFAALEGQYRPQGRNSRWMEALFLQLLRGEETVQALFAENPFPDQPPRYLRATLYDYRFTTHAERSMTGDWWLRSELGPYLPPISLQQ